MALSLQQLQTPPTRSEIVDWLIEVLQELGFVTTGWQPGRVQHTILSMVATAAEPLAQSASVLISFAYNKFAQGAALDLYSESRFDNTRDAAEKASGSWEFVNSGPIAHVIKPGTVVATDAQGTFFLSDGEVTVNAYSTESVPMIAALAGSAGANVNEPVNLQTPLAGVAVTVPTEWPQTTAGQDPQIDFQLQTENANKWGLLAVEKTDAAYRALALRQDGVRKSLVVSNNPRGAGTVDLLVASNFSTVPVSVLNATQDAFAEYTFLTDPSGSVTPTSTCQVLNPDVQPLDLVGVVFFEPSIPQSSIENRVNAALEALLTRVPIGGFEYSNADVNQLTVADITDAIKSARGVTSVTLTTPAADLVIGQRSLLTRPVDGWFAPDKLVTRESVGG